MSDERHQYPTAKTAPACYATTEAVTHGISREAARQMTYNQYVYAQSERSRLTYEGMRRELTGDEVKRLKQAQAAVLGYLDWFYGPDPVVYAKTVARPGRGTVRERGKAGRLGRLLHRH